MASRKLYIESLELEALARTIYLQQLLAAKDREVLNCGYYDLGYKRVWLNWFYTLPAAFYL